MYFPDALLWNISPPIARCPNDKWPSGCQRCVTLLPAGSEKHLPGCRELCLYLMWNDTYMTAKKSEHNCSLSNKLKCRRRLHQLVHLQSRLLFFQQLPFFVFQMCDVAARKNTLIFTADDGCQARYLTHWMWSSPQPPPPPSFFPPWPKCFCMFRRGWLDNVFLGQQKCSP